MFDVHIIDANDANDWDNLVERTPDSSLYHLWDWGETLANLYRYKKYYFTASSKDGIIGAFPLTHVKSRFFGNRLISSPFCEYGGPIADPSLSDQETHDVISALLDAAQHLAERLNVEYIETRGIRSKIIEDMMLQSGYVDLQRYMTYKVDLTRDVDEIWASLHKNRTRKSIKKAIKSNVATREVDKTEQLKEFYTLYLKSEKRLGSPPHKYELFRKLYETFRPKDRMKVFLAYYSEIPIGGIIVYCHRKTIFDWNSVTDYAYRNLNSHNLLLWNVIEWGNAHGYQNLDLGRTRKGTTISDFKSGWGGVETNLSEHIYYLGLEKKEPADAMQRKYRYLAKAWSFLPSSLAEVIGPRIISGIAL